MKEIIRTFGPVIRYQIWRLTGVYNPDLEQEVYLRLWQNQEKYTEQGTQKAYIKTVTENLCKDFKRSKSYQVAQEQISEEELLELPENKPLLEDIVDLKKRQKIVLKAVNDLPAPLKKVILLFHFEEMKEKEIAERLRVPVGTVKSRLFTARNLLSSQLQNLKGK